MKNALIVLALVLAGFACSKRAEVIQPAACSATQLAYGVEVTCPGDTPVTIEDGAPGENASPCTVESVEGGAQINCPNTSAFITNGATGLMGEAGASCTVITVGTSDVAPNGGAEITCGSTSALILNGTNGTNATSVTPVQFCPGVTTYANEFNELGFCISGSLYAVYSENDGFLSEIPPGNYSSDGINASCTFTVEANCVITNN